MDKARGARYAGILAFLLAGGTGLGGGCGENGFGKASPAPHKPTGQSVRSTGGSLRFYRMRGRSMEPTLPVGTRLAVAGEEPSIGDVVAAHPAEQIEEYRCGVHGHSVREGGSACDTPSPRASRTVIISRIVAGPGDRIFIRRGEVYRKVGGGSGPFVREAAAFIRTCASGRGGCSLPHPITIPPGHWFLMGDNRGESDDSRFWGPIASGWVVGVAVKYRYPRY